MATSESAEEGEVTSDHEALKRKVGETALRRVLYIHTGLGIPGGTTGSRRGSISGTSSVVGRTRRNGAFAASPAAGDVKDDADALSLSAEDGVPGVRIPSRCVACGQLGTPSLGGVNLGATLHGLHIGLLVRGRGAVGAFGAL
jgi:hypothetical protein